MSDSVSFSTNITHYLPECKSRGAFGRQHVTGIESANCKLSLDEKLERRKLPNVPSQMMLLVVYVYPSV